MPQSRCFLAPQACEVKVSYAAFVPIRIEKQSTLSQDVPNPTPANFVALFIFPAKIALID